MSSTIRLAANEVKTLAFGAIGGAYMGIGDTFESAARILFVQNLTDALLMFSFDGITDHFPLSRSGYLLLDITMNKTDTQGLFLAEGQRLYVMQIDAPTEGAVYVSTFFGAAL